jgi:hypothetical protein
VALVITLLLLSVITFLAVAFLAMSRRNQSAVTASLDTTTAQAMAGAAQARAQAEIMAQILASGDALQYDYMVSRNAINPAGFNNKSNKVYNPDNVNYDYLANTGTPTSPGTPMTNSGNEQTAWVQNIANQFYDPRPPVFVVTNPAYPNNYDFRFYVDINRNERFETNGYQNTFPVEPPAGQRPEVGSPAVLNGEPEFIGVLRNPLQHHSSTNLFIGRYAYMVLPIGKELDLNYIHNFLKATYGNVGGGNVLKNTSTPGLSGSLGVSGAENDGFARDQGIGSWELNLAGLLDNLSPWAYENVPLGYIGYLSQPGGYSYVPPKPSLYDIGIQNTGNAFDDAEAILHYRYMPPNYALNSLFRTFPAYFQNFDYQNFENAYLDIYCANAPKEAPFDYDAENPPIATSAYKTVSRQPWPGSYQTNMFFDPQELFDPTKTSPYFTNRMILASQRTNTYDRYTFQRLLSSIGMGSSPEYGVWVYGDRDISNSIYAPGPFPPQVPNVLRTKININFDNTAQITNANAPYVPMPTNLVSWQPTTFFNNAAELMLRSQTFTYTNFMVPGFPRLELMTFGVTNIPIYRANNPGIHYDAAVHRILQLAANIYDATINTNAADSAGNTGLIVRHPTVFRPVFQVFNPGKTNASIYISGYVQVTNDAIFQMTRKPFQEVTNVLTKLHPFDTNGNVAGIPWIVAAEKGNPGFYRYTAGSQVMLERKLLFPRQVVNGVVKTNLPPASTNQFFCMSVTNCLAVDTWNPYPTLFYGSAIEGGGLYYYYSNYVTIQITNNYNFGTNIFLETNNYPYTLVPRWAAGGGAVGTKAGFLQVINNTNQISLPEAYYSESLHAFRILTNGDNLQNSWLAGDLGKPSGWPVYNWSVNVTNHIVYALFDGVPGSGGALLDFVNLGPFGSTMSLTNLINSAGSSGLAVSGGYNPGAFWAVGSATSLPNSPMSAGVLNQIQKAEQLDAPWAQNLIGQGTDGQPNLGCAYEPGFVLYQPTNWVVNDPLVHYTLEDLTWPTPAIIPQPVDISHSDDPLSPSSVLAPPLASYTDAGKVSARYAPWGSKDTLGKNMLFKDPLITDSLAWNFPTNKFPSIGWIGRVHRGTPWQTVFLKADTNAGNASYLNWSQWANPNWLTTNAPETYPTNDYPLLDVFTAVPNDNAAHGLLSVNQTNDPAWAALFAGVIALTSDSVGVPINPNSDVQFLMDSPIGINAQRTNQPNGIFHKVGYILSAPALTVNSPFLLTNASAVPNLTDEMVERIPQQTLSLLKVGEPQFAIYAWGQALKPKGPPYLGIGANANMYTNYEITGEFLTRTICHLVHTNGLKMVIDSYNVESGNN